MINFDSFRFILIQFDSFWFISIHFDFGHRWLVKMSFGRKEKSLSHKRNCPRLFSRKCICEGRGACGSWGGWGCSRALRNLKNNQNPIQLISEHARIKSVWKPMLFVYFQQVVFCGVQRNDECLCLLWNVLETELATR